MMPSLPSFIPLYFDETESDLWKAIQQIEPEMRSPFIKEALRLVLQSYSAGEKFLTRSITKNLEEILEIQEDRARIGTDEENNEQDSVENHTVSLEDDIVEMETFSLEALFIEGHVPDPNENKPISSQGYQYMMKNIIGLEDDEAVLKVFQGLSEQRNK